jgi:ABC-type transport system involved in multi-copper enzyme maturation permease subunit
MTELTVTDPGHAPEPEPEAHATVAPVTHRRRFSAFARVAAGVAAIGVKDLRGRMRGRRAFVVLTIYLLLLAGFALMIETLIERSYQTGFGGSSAFASAAIGQGIFAALLMLMTLQVVFLAPSSTAGSISLEREKQTLDLLVTTPISSLAIVVGKLLSALVWVFLLILASLPLMAAVFVYGGVGPEGVLAGYIVLVATAFGLGSFGILCSSLVRRTTAATAITIFGVLVVTIGTAFILIFWAAMGTFDNNGNRVGGPFGMRAPAVLGYINPFIAQADVMCDQQSSIGGMWCEVVRGLVPTNDGIVFVDAQPGIAPVPVMEDPAVDGKGGVVVGRGVGVAPGDGVIADDVVQQQVFQGRDALWPKSVVTWIVLSVIFLAVSVQLVSPTRRWRLRGRRRTSKGVSA